MTFRHHLRPDEHDTVGDGEAGERRRERARAVEGVRVQADPFQLGQLQLELALQALGARAEAGELRGAAGRARVGLGLRDAAVVTTKPAVLVQDEGDVAVVATKGRAARTAVQGWCHAATVQQEDRLAAAFRDCTELGEQGRREWITRFAT